MYNSTHNYLKQQTLALIEQTNDSAFYPISLIKRTDPALIQVVSELKDSEHLDLKIVEVPDDVQWKIEEGEMGQECVREVSRCWS